MGDDVDYYLSCKNQALIGHILALIPVAAVLLGDGRGFDIPIMLSVFFIYVISYVAEFIADKNSGVRFLLFIVITILLLLEWGMYLFAIRG